MQSACRTRQLTRLRPHQSILRGSRSDDWRTPGPLYVRDPGVLEGTYGLQVTAAAPMTCIQRSESSLENM
jgi:hypothetical protein